MTMPHERTRGLKWAHEMLVEVSSGVIGTTTDRHKSRVLLDDFPTPAHVLSWLEVDAALPCPAASAIEQAGALLSDLRLSVDCPPS